MIDLLRKRLERYRAADLQSEEQAVKEILQEVTLYALWRADFFELAAFQGGTSLRILHGLPRFSDRRQTGQPPVRQVCRSLRPTLSRVLFF